MPWTTSLPSQAGMYWVKTADGSTQLVTVREQPFTGCATVRPALVATELNALTGTEQWEGPIQPPL
jgi:hypothetical protein